MLKFALFVMLSIAVISCGESKEEYVGRLKSFADSVTAETGFTLKIADIRVRTWTNAIFDKSMTDYLTGEATGAYVSDFNTALTDFEISPVMKVLKEVRTNHKKSIDSTFATLKDHPDEADEAYAVAKELYANYLKAHKLAFDPSGSLETYRAQVRACDAATSELQSKFEIEAP